MQIMEGDVIRTIREAQPSIGHYHTAGNPGRNDLDEEQELYYPAILQAIRATGYAGFIAHEFIPKGDPVVALRSAFERCAPYL
jgi:hydroxypyruvate isomerase